MIDFNLYHITSVENAVSILNENTLRLGDSYITKDGGHASEKGPKCVCFTRNKNLLVIMGVSDNSFYPLVRFIIDKNKLRNHYRIRPRFENWGTDDFYLSIGMGTERCESEEVVLKDINNFTNYVKEIQILGDTENKHIPRLKEKCLESNLKLATYKTFRRNGDPLNLRIVV